MRARFILVLLTIFVSITASVQAHEEDILFTVKVVDAASGAAIENIIVAIESESGVIEQKILTDSEGSGRAILPPGTYRLKAQITVFGIPIQISSTEITLDEPTEFIYTVSNPQYIPTAVYGTTGLLALSGIAAYFYMKKMKPRAKVRKQRSNQHLQPVPLVLPQRPAARARTEKRRYCMHCGAQMSIEDRACPNPKCGLGPPGGTDVKGCPNCGEVIPSQAKFCSVCGASQPPRAP